MKVSNQDPEGISKWNKKLYCLLRAVSFLFAFFRALKPEEVVITGLESNKTKKLELTDDDGTRGRGVIAEEDIKAGEFVVEYKYNECYKAREKKSREKEYVTNTEGCYILEVQLPDGKGWLCLDATRNMSCWGRYINHSATPNLKMWKPLLMRGKWRVGFLAMRDIQKGEELTYNYGKQKNPPDWMNKNLLKVRTYLYTFFLRARNSITSFVQLKKSKKTSPSEEELQHAGTLQTHSGT